MQFVETTVFTEAITELLDDDAYSALQAALLLRPQAGPVIRGSGGLRKVRWSLQGIGKRGGIRVIYYWDESTETFYMLYVFRVRISASPRFAFSAAWSGRSSDEEN
jgi:mRNA-degrading endonuclease RelE of RelBE toxin-antitoxin system